MQNLLDEDSVDFGFDDEISSFLKRTNAVDKLAEALIWEKTNEDRFPSIAKVALDILCIQESSMARETCF